MSTESKNDSPNEPGDAGRDPVVAKSQEGRLQERTAFETVGLVAGVVGITAIAFGMVLYAIDPAVSRLALGNAAFGAVAVIFYVVTNRSAFGRSLAGRSTTFIALEVLIVIGVVAGVGVINYFAAQNPTEWDLTRDGVYTLHEQSIQVARDLKQDVKVIGFFRTSETQPRGTLTQTVDLYRQYTDRLSVEFINPDNPPRDLIKKYDLSSQSPRIIVAAENGQFAKMRVPTEERMTNALISVAQRDARKVYFLTGHGEPKIEAPVDAPPSEEGLTAAASSLRNEGFAVETLALVDRANVPADAALVVLAGARSPLLPNEVEALKVHLDRGGRALVLLEPGLDLGLARIFRPYGVEVGDNIIIDPSRNQRRQGFGPDAAVIKDFEAHPITNKLQGSAAVFVGSRSVQPRTNLAQVDVTTLIQSGDTSWGETNYRDPNGLVRDENDVPGPVPLAVAITRNTAANRKKVADEARMVVVGDTTFANNRFVTMVGNRDFFLNAANWLVGDEDRITIRPRPKYGDRLPLTPAQQDGIMFFSVNLLPLLIIAVGFSVWAIRQRQ